MSDNVSVVMWWFIIQALGIAVWPLAARWLPWLPDRGYTLAKPLGLLLASYSLWLLATLGIVQNSIGSILVMVIMIAIASAWIYRSDSWVTNPRPSLLAWLREHRVVVIVYELLFAVAFVAWAIFRAHNPDLSTTEKPMEFAFFNAIGRSAVFPPQDPWLAGYGIAYYYFGYVMMSVLHQLSGVTPGTAFSLSNALWFALSAAGAFGVIANMILLSDHRAKIAAAIFGVLGAVMLVLMGNFEMSLEIGRVGGIVSPQMLEDLDILELSQPYVPQPGYPNWPPRSGWWWWRASRVIHDYPPETVSPQLAPVLGRSPDVNTTSSEVIDEFPQFSFLLGDMHPHVLALPYTLLAMALALNLYQAAAHGEMTALRTGRNRAPLWLLYALVVGGLSFLNTWDFPIYAFVLIAAFALGRWQARALSIWGSLLDLITLGVAAFMLYIPFYRGFTSQAAGIAPNVFNGTSFAQFFVMFGPFIVIGSLLGITLIVRITHERRIGVLSFVIKSIVGGISVVFTTTFGMIAVALVILSVSKGARDWFDKIVTQMNGNGIDVSDHLLARLSDPWVPLALAIAMVTIALLWRAHYRRTHMHYRSTREDDRIIASPIDFVLLLYLIGLLLTFGVEFVFVIDTFGSRMNTVFKLYYQAWTLWSVASAFAVYWLMFTPVQRVGSKSGSRIIAGFAAVLVVSLGLMYPILVIPDKIEDVSPTLDAVQATAQYVPDEYSAAKWLNDHVTGTPIILEAIGDEYNAGTSRMSTWTGLPTLVGWPYHELQWRGNYDEQGTRVPIIAEIYSTTDTLRARALLDRYSIEYVYVGPNERRQYSQNSLAKFDKMLALEFEQGGIRIYRVFPRN